MPKNSIAVIAFCLLAFSVAAQQNFVKTKGCQFTIAGKPYYYIGTITGMAGCNCWAFGGIIQNFSTQKQY